MKFPPFKRATRFTLMLTLAMVLSSGAALAETVDFSLKDVEGKTHRLSDYRGKWVIVNYWATWCPPCLTEIPELVDFHEDYQARDAVVLGINFEEIETARLTEFVEDYFINYPVLLEKPGRSSVMGKIPGLPTTFVVSPKGEIVARQVGGVTGQMLREFIEEHDAAEAGNVLTAQ